MLPGTGAGVGVEGELGADGCEVDGEVDGVDGFEDGAADGAVAGLLSMVGDLLP